MSRKRICLLTIFPEGEYQQRILSGVFTQCAKYDYDVVVVSPLVQISASNEEYLKGELSIYDLVNFDLFDGVIITPIPMTEDRINSLIEKLTAKLKAECKVPVVSIDMPVGDYPTVYTDDGTAFSYITEHLIQVHNCKNFSILSGFSNVSLCKVRIDAIVNTARKYNITISQKQIYEGDFWYTSGEMLGSRYVKGELELPDAVICLSDHMAIGLTNYLIKHGINVPGKVLVTGYEAVHEASMNTPPITSYSADQKKTGSQAVNYLHKIIDSDQNVFPSEEAGFSNLCIGGTCGCPENYKYTRERLTYSQVNSQYDYSDTSPEKKITLGMLLESYMTERLTGTASPFECLSEIYDMKYLIKPFERFCMCANQKWLNKSYCCEKPFSEEIGIVLTAERNATLHGVKNHVFLDKKEVSFDKKKMIPALFEDYPEPQVFYFFTLHFGKTILGYTVLQNNLSSPGKMDTVFRNFMRNVNNALEMSRAKYQIAYLSEHDTMTELYNRRGMEHKIEEMKKHCEKDSVWFVIVIDMDGLKIRNDTYGHAEGDSGIAAVAEAAASITEAPEICVRGGGDEFFVIGLGKYTEEDMQRKLDAFQSKISELNEGLVIPASASIGSALGNISEMDYQEVMEIADERMYENKQSKKK